MLYTFTADRPHV